MLSIVAYPNLPSDGWGAADCGACQLDNGVNAAASPLVNVFEQQSRHMGFSLIGFGDGHAKAVRDVQITLDMLNGYHPH